MVTGAVAGRAEARFRPVVDAFADNFTERGDLGAALCVYEHGRPVVDVWGGIADAVVGRPWAADTICPVFSASKGVTSIVVHHLVAQGELDLDRPVCHWWPEFAAAGKDAITVRQLLAHQAGLPIVDAELTWDEVRAWGPVVDALAAQTPRWPPGTAHGYHLRTFGWLVGELVRRAGGRSVGTVLAEDLAGPLGAEVWIGLPAALEPRVATLVPPPQAVRDFLAGLPDDVLLGRATTGPSGLLTYDDRWNEREVHAMELPSSNGIASARGLARLFAATIGEVDGRRLLPPEVVVAATAVQSHGVDRTLMVDTTFGSGFLLGPSLTPACARSAFGHSGAGGSLAFADPVTGVAFAYVMNEMRMDLGPDERRDAPVRALRGIVG